MPYCDVIGTIDKRVFAAGDRDSPPCLNVTVIVVIIDEAMEPQGKILCGRGGAGARAQLRGMTMVMVLSFVKTGHAEVMEPEDYLYAVGVVAGQMCM
jgi:hypothetical protein